MRLLRPAPAEQRPLHAASERAPRPEADQLLLEVQACAICRTDLQIVEGDLVAHRLPVTPGHQVVGVVIEVGREVAGWAVGDYAGVGWLAAVCGTCSFCNDGRENLCRDAVFTGWDSDGGYARHATVRADFALPIPTGVDPISAAPLLCGGVIGYRALRASGIEPGGRLGLYGFGASASLALQVARHWGCDVYVCTRSVADQRRALEMGATWAGDYGASPPRPLDAAVTFAPAGDVVLSALQALDRGGTVAINAIHLDRVPEFPYEWLWWERGIRSVANYTRDDARDFLQLAEEIPLTTSPEVYELADANEALLALKEGRVSGAAVLRCAGSD